MRSFRHMNVLSALMLLSMGPAPYLEPPVLNSTGSTHTNRRSQKKIRIMRRRTGNFPAARCKG